MNDQPQIVIKVEVVNKIKFWKDYQFWLPFFISIFTFISTIIISFNLYSPFKLEIADSIYLLPNSFIDNKKYRPENLTLVIPITFLNAAKNAGLIEDIYLNVQYASNTYLNNHPASEIDVQGLFRDCSRPTIQGEFKPFILRGEEQLQKTFIFSLGNITEGDYMIDLYIKAAGRLKKMDTIKITVNTKMKEEYLKGNMLYDISTQWYSVLMCQKTSQSLI